MGGWFECRLLFPWPRSVFGLILHILRRWRLSVSLCSFLVGQCPDNI